MGERHGARPIAGVKNAQAAVGNADIARIDARPETKGGRMIKTTTSTNTESHDKVAAPGPQSQLGPSSSTSTSFSNRPKPDFDTIYRRGAGAPQQTGLKPPHSNASSPTPDSPEP